MPFAQQLGRYQLLDRIAFGGMAEIYRAKTFDPEGRTQLVAIKKILGHLISDEDFLRMLVDEAKITALLQHENIARVYEFVHEGDEYFLAMEYVDGKDVRTLLERHRHAGRPLPPEHVAYIAMEAALALDAAHTQKDGAGRPLHIVHRDVSPSNLLISYRGEVKLCDFGIAKATFTRAHTRTGVIKGKVKYMSPEQAMGRKLDHRSDLFSLGTVMYEMLTLQPPFSAATEVELIFAVRDARKADARALEPAVPEELDAIVNKLMARSRSQRYQSGAEAALALRGFLERDRPAYRRSSLGRFMRGLFETDIERELRLLEDYVIAGADPDKVGENLIAEALGADAPYTQFTAVSRSSLATGWFPRVEAKAVPDLHAQPTRILTRNQVTPAPPPPVPLSSMVASSSAAAGGGPPHMPSVIAAGAEPGDSERLPPVRRAAMPGMPSRPDDPLHTPLPPPLPAEALSHAAALPSLPSLHEQPTQPKYLASRAPDAAEARMLPPELRTAAPIPMYDLSDLHAHATLMLLHTDGTPVADLPLGARPTLILQRIGDDMPSILPRDTVESAPIDLAPPREAGEGAAVVAPSEPGTDPSVPIPVGDAAAPGPEAIAGPEATPRRHGEADSDERTSVPLSDEDIEAV